MNPGHHKRLQGQYSDVPEGSKGVEKAYGTQVSLLHVLSSPNADPHRPLNQHHSYLADSDCKLLVANFLFTVAVSFFPRIV